MCVLKDDQIEVASYDQVLYDVMTTGSDLELVNLFGISAAFSTAFRSYIPLCAAVGLRTSSYNVVVRGRGVASESISEFTLMWTMSVKPKRFQAFRSNHIVYLAKRHDREEILSDSDGADDYNSNKPAVLALQKSFDAVLSDDDEPLDTTNDDGELRVQCEPNVHYRNLSNTFLLTEDQIKLLTQADKGQYVFYLSLIRSLIVFFSLRNKT